MFKRNFVRFLLLTPLLVTFGCQRNIFETPTVAPASLRDVPALKLNFRFETDVPAPPVNETVQTEERNAAVQADFDQNRTQELLDKTVSSPDKQKVLAIYHRVGDLPSEFRLDMYAADGKLLRKITHDGMAVHFQDTIVWSPDSSAVAFVAMVRSGQTNSATPENASNQTANQANSSPNNEANVGTDANSNTQNTNNTDANAENANVNPPATPTPQVEQPKMVLTFRTEQIYICDSNGGDVKPITQNEGLIYFYYIWSPDSSALVALAATYQEWNYLQYQAEGKTEQFTPMGRPRLVEKNGRERRLDDNLTSVQPVWSPDSAKVAVAFERQVRIYDAIGDAPTQAAIPLRNQLLVSSQAFDEELQRKEQGGEVNSNINAQTSTITNANQTPNQTPNLPAGTLPDENTLVSFNPIIKLEWTEDKMLYVQTGYIKLMKNEADSARSYLRWHRLIFSPQAVAR
ncbi:MAG: DPP IV N-terminal domain-containing protein [Acidobacteria bacterium]|nr:DPP IV N-terminal domain-containing protein [Acidobacteriota bacterium]MCA1639507.1 DPP IV N-terminal domain-containing protein [Acidobacteriota bacterium]